MTIEQIRSQRFQKIKELKKRQEKREADGLYRPDAVEGEDYIVCPITEVRFTKIRKPHITKTLAMTEEEYYELCPEMKGKVAANLSKKISSGLKEMAYDENNQPILDDNGKHLTKHEYSHMKSMKTLNEVDPKTGKRRYDMLGEKTRSTHLSKKDEYGRNGYQRIASKAIINGNKTKSEKYGHESWSLPFQRYERMIEFLLKYVKPFISKGVTLSKVTDKGDGYQIDHKYSIVSGWNNKISPFCIGHVENLDLILKSENLAKNNSNSIELDELLDKTNYTIEQAQEEFKRICDLLEEDHNNGVNHSSLYVLERLGMLDKMKPFYKIKELSEG